MSTVLLNPDLLPNDILYVIPSKSEIYTPIFTVRLKYASEAENDYPI